MTASDRARAWAIVAEVEDPELPHVTLGDLGIVREVHADGKRACVTLTPTYSGCPATEQIRTDVEAALRDGGFEADVQFAMSPAWTTDWITDAGRAKLRAVGIAPPPAAVGDHATLLDLPVECPRCGSRQTRRLSDFGSTACKASYKCTACAEPFEHVKAI